MKQATLFFWIVFISMCVFKLWFTLLGVILLAMSMTFKQKKRGYCYQTCPVGYLQDETFTRDRIEKRKLKYPEIWRKVIFLVFWGYLIIALAQSYGQATILWGQMIQLMLFSSFTALALQYFYRKRIWCSSLCPVGSVLNRIVRLRRQWIQRQCLQIVQHCFFLSL